MNRGTRAVLLVFAFGAAAIVCAIGVGWWWWAQHGAKWQTDVGEGITEGSKFGKQTDQNGCLAEAFKHHRLHPEIEAGMRHSMFLTGCLMNAERVAGFCAEVPSQWNSFASARWTEQRCAAEGLPSPGCAGMLNAVVTYCQNADSK